MDTLSTEHIGYYHVIIRGRNRKQVFEWDADRWTYVNYLRSQSKKLGIGVHAWTLMSNHVHLLVKSFGMKAISDFLRAVNGAFARKFNRSRMRTGAVWQVKPLKEAVVFESYFINCCLYIEYNPLRAGLAEEFDDYNWSSAAFHMYGKDDGLTVPSAWYQSLGNTAAERQLAYRQLMKSYHDEQMRREA